MRFNFKEKRIKKTKDFDSIFSLFLDEFNIKNEINIEKVKQSWGTIIGPLLASHSTPESFNNNVLYIMVDHSVFSNDIIMMKGEIIKKINSMFSSSLYDIRITSAKKYKGYSGFKRK